MAFKISDKISKIAKKKMKSRYPNLDSISFFKKLHKHLSLKREFYEDLFNQFLKEELKNIEPILKILKVDLKYLKNWASQQLRFWRE